MKSMVAKFIDNLLLAIAVWLFSAIVALYFVRQLYIVAIVATVCAMGVTLALRLRQKKNAEREKDRYRAELVAQHFLFRDDRYALDYFFDALKTRYKVTKRAHYLRINDTVIVPCLTEPLPLKRAVFYYSDALRVKAKALVILTSKTEKFPVNLKDKLIGIKLDIFDKDMTYRLLKSLNKLPAEEKPVKSRKLKGFVTSALNPKRAKGYLFSAFILLFSAYFSIFSLYFVICSAVCITMVLLCKFNIAERIKKQS